MHKRDPTWEKTQAGEARGYIDTPELTELWFHTGTTCNLRCPFCLEGSKPGDNRIEAMALADAKPFIDEAVSMNTVKQFSFTGGEPFVIPEFIRILSYALEKKPCLVLSNGTEPLLNKMADVEALLKKPQPLHFRISLDYPDTERHDAGRGKGNFETALKTLRILHEKGFGVSIARQQDNDENAEGIEAAFAEQMARVGITEPINIVSFPDFLTPGSLPDVPEISENCMTEYHSEETRAMFMCAYSRMVLKKNGTVRVYACTLVDDDVDYDLGETLKASLSPRIRLKHHRCYSCFAYGASCSE